MKLLSLSLLASISFLSTSAAAHDDRCNDSSCHVWRGGFNTGDKVSDLKYWLDSSVSDAGYTSIIKFGASSWNNISTSVSLSQVSKKNDSQVRVYVSYYSQFWDGQWEPYYTDSKGNLNFDGNNFEDWSLGNIRLNLQQIKNRSSSFKKKVAVHEFGHSLSLAHNMDDVSVMKPGELSFNEPQKADKTHLKNRWK
ncbi:matrixin family metalloprotease [Brevibacillus agri]|uniref:matrixin family metalloprotease n=1 Tax=Brevibacillus agri TaxID=51101 RepID=UPI002E1FFAF2|nr:matrixin family metalloprotease [Brevibacillus agri]MED3501571.1 matrixin family metalloprotease [Brevibacillus agri]